MRTYKITTLLCTVLLLAACGDKNGVQVQDGKNEVKIDDKGISVKGGDGQSININKEQGIQIQGAGGQNITVGGPMADEAIKAAQEALKDSNTVINMGGNVTVQGDKNK